MLWMSALLAGFIVFAYLYGVWVSWYLFRHNGEHCWDVDVATPPKILLMHWALAWWLVPISCCICIWKWLKQ